MRKRERDRQIRKAMHEVEEALAPFPRCCQQRLLDAACVLKFGKRLAEIMR